MKSTSVCAFKGGVTPRYFYVYYCFSNGILKFCSTEQKQGIAVFPPRSPGYINNAISYYFATSKRYSGLTLKASITLHYSISMK